MLLPLLACHRPDPVPPPDTGDPLDGALLGRGLYVEAGGMWVSAPRIDGSGAALRFDGASLAPAVTLAATAPGQIGDAMAWCPDLDGDGQDDLVVGAPGVGTRGGSWWFGAPTADGTVDGATFVEGLRDDGHAGTMIACGDLDGDGATDVATSAPDSDGIGLARFGGTIELWDAHRAKVANLDSTWDQSHLGFRSSVAMRDNLDGDGIADLVVGSYGADQLNVWSGPVVGTGDANQAESLVGVRGDGTGYSVATGDVDGDGASDLVFGAPTYGGRGGVWVVLGPLDGQDQILARYDRAHLIVGAGGGDQAGFSVAVVGDVDGDGASDWLAGAPGAGGVGPEAGAAYLVLGTGAALLDLDHADAVVVGTVAGAKLGWAVGGGDLDLDGAIDLVVTAPETDRDDVRGAGAVFVFPGTLRGRTDPAHARWTLE